MSKKSDDYMKCLALSSILSNGNLQESLKIVQLLFHASHFFSSFVSNAMVLETVIVVPFMIL
jgi:hypothetical protein